MFVPDPILLRATVMLKIVIIMMKILKRSSSYCRDSTQASHPHRQNGLTRDLWIPCRFLCWTHNGRSCLIFLPRENKTFPQKIPCSSLAKSVCCEPQHGWATTPWLWGREWSSFLHPGSCQCWPSARPGSFRPWCSCTSWLFVFVHLRKINHCPS